MANLFGPEDYEENNKDYDWWHDADYDPVANDPDLDNIDIVDDDPNCY